MCGESSQQCHHLICVLVHCVCDVPLGRRRQRYNNMRGVVCWQQVGGLCAHYLLVKVVSVNLERELEAADSLSETPGSHIETCLCRVGIGHTEPISERPIANIRP